MCFRRRHSDRERHPGFKQLHVIAAHVGFFVAFHANAVTRAMREIDSVTGLLDHLTCNPVHIRARDAGLCSRAAGGVRFLHDSVDLLIFVFHRAYRKGTRQVGNIPIMG